MQWGIHGFDRHPQQVHPWFKISTQLSAWPCPGGEYPYGGDATDPQPLSLTSSIPPRSNGGMLEGTSPSGPGGIELMPSCVKSDYACVA